ncbi:trypsin-like serine peptidase [Sinimarinibacterium thermocellulolyticum]|uniref:Trypsin-like peptidase domain-containing protein n=1 Tax=Sinimarinibacterium thermocellulolyticum TaxID=3170016 RepID=A0ABV2A9W7_9GAMM
MRRLLLALSLLWLSGACAALTPELADLDAVPLHAAPPAAVAKAIAQAPARKGAGPAIFAVTVDLPVTLDGGVWDEAAPGIARWRARVFSAQARALLMRFDRFFLPSSARLWIYDAQGRTVQGPYLGAAHNGIPELWTATVPGDIAVIELQVDAAERAQVELALASIGHAFKNARDRGDSGSCNIDTACPLGNAWRDEIRATVKLQIPTGAFVGVCSGTLINNLAQDDTPYILTADHCGIRSDNAGGVVVYWNFQNSGCNRLDAPDNQNQTGTLLRARDPDTDMTLLELRQPPSAAFNVYYAGWDASGTGGSSGVSIHHPSGDAKKISEYVRALTADFVTIEANGPSIPAWRVTWNQGTTEQGSSGSGLWNQNRQIVGVLSGGSASCNNLDAPDFYARLDRQWLAKPQASGQLKVWLDPANTGQRQVAGKNPNATPTPTPSPTPTPTAPASGGSGGGNLGLPLLGALLGFGLLRRRRG